MLAYGIVNALLDMKYRIPEDYSVCGFDNIFPSSFNGISLTTIEHSLSEKKGTMPLNCLKEKLKPEQTLLRCRLSAASNIVPNLLSEIQPVPQGHLNKHQAKRNRDTPQKCVLTMCAYVCRVSLLLRVLIILSTKKKRLLLILTTFQSSCLFFLFSLEFLQGIAEKTMVFINVPANGADLSVQDSFFTLDVGT